jgi:choline dehydrogenase-like flavoprotein
MPDIVIIGSGVGGATAALGLASSGANITILERGAQLPNIPENRDARAIFQGAHFRSAEPWYDERGKPFLGGNYYNHGGNSKFYGAVLSRFRQRDFDGISYLEGDVPAWPFTYGEMAPWYDKAEQTYRVRGSASEDPTEPPRSMPLPFGPVPDEPVVAQVRQKLQAVGLRPFSLPLGIDIDAWLKHGKTSWDGFPDARTGKMDAETCALIPALAFPNVKLESNARVQRLLRSSDGTRIEAVEYVQDGQTKTLRAKFFVLAAGAIPSAAILLASAEGGLANGSGQVGRNLMSHNTSALIGFDRHLTNDAVYQKTFGINDFYLSAGPGANGPGLGNVQLLGRVSGIELKANVRYIPEQLLQWFSRHTMDFFIMTEDLPDASNRVRVDQGKTILDWRRNNESVHRELIAQFRLRLREAGFQFEVTKLFDRRSPSHQCGTIRMGHDAALAPLDQWGRAFDCANLFVTDASTFVSSAAVNPALTVAALALRTANHIRTTELKA